MAEYTLDNEDGLLAVIKKDGNLIKALSPSFSASGQAAENGVSIYVASHNWSYLFVTEGNSIIINSIPAAVDDKEALLAAILKTVFPKAATSASPTVLSHDINADQSDDTKAGAAKAIYDFVVAKVAALVNSSPTALDTLKELADAMGDDPNFATTITNALAGKVNSADILNAFTQTASGKVADARTVKVLRDFITALWRTVTPVKQSAYTAIAGDIVPVDTTNGNVPIAITPGLADDTEISVKHVIQGGSNSPTINLSGGETFNVPGGSTTFNLPLKNQGAILKKSGSIWYVIADDLSLGQLDARYLNQTFDWFFDEASLEGENTAANPIKVATALLTTIATNTSNIAALQASQIRTLGKAANIANTTNGVKNLLYSVVIQGGTLGGLSAIEIRSLWTLAGTATKAYSIELNGTPFVSYSQTASGSLKHDSWIQNQNAVNVQVAAGAGAGNAATIGSSGGSVNNYAINFANAVTLAVYATSTEAMKLDGIFIKLVP